LKLIHVDARDPHYLSWRRGRNPSARGRNARSADSRPYPRVRVHAAGLNLADIMQREGKYPAPPGYPENIPGLEFAGEVEAIGEAVRAWKVGDRVFGTGVEVILDLVGGAYFPANLRALASRGRLICVGTTAGPKAEIDLGLLLRKRATIIGTVLRARSMEEKAKATRRFAAAVLPLVERGAVRPVIEKVYPADEIRAAHETSRVEPHLWKDRAGVCLAKAAWQR